MEPKTSLNNTQRKMLDTIFSERIQKKVSAYREKRQQERAKLTKQELEKAEKSKEVKELIKIYKDMKAREKALKDKGIKVSTSYDGSIKVELGGRYDDNLPFALEAFDAETRKVDEKINESTTEVRARIYGMDTSYEQVDKELLDYFSFLEK